MGGAETEHDKVRAVARPGRVGHLVVRHLEHLARGEKCVPAGSLEKTPQGT